MHQFLLNRIPTTAAYQPKLKKVNFDKIRKIVQKGEQRKLESVKQTFSFIKDIGERDAEYFRGLHTDLVDEIKKSIDNNNIVYPEVVVEEVVEEAIDDNDDLFDN